MQLIADGRIKIGKGMVLVQK